MEVWRAAAAPMAAVWAVAMRADLSVAAVLLVAVEWVEEEMGMEEDEEAAREAAAWEAASWEERKEEMEMGEETVVVAMEAAQGVERMEAAKEAVLRVAVRGMGMVEVVLVVEQTGEALEEEVKEKVEEKDKE